MSESEYPSRWGSYSSTQASSAQSAAEQEVRDEPNSPPEWDYNPSAWSQRIPIVVLAVIGFGIAGYMALFQLGVLATVWDPFFGDGTRRVLTSKVSEAFPVSDALLGAFGYLLDAVTGAIGGTKRWKTMPWIVVIFGLAVGPLGAVSIALVMMQPLTVGYWCTLCLTTAAISILMIGPAMDEFLASLQHVRRERLKGRSTWRVFWGLED
jgi:uncharacterized membrane protein